MSAWTRDENGRMLRVAATLSGRSAVEIGGTSYWTDGSVIFEPTATRPDAADAHAVIPYGYHLDPDTGVLSRNTGTAWVS